MLILILPHHRACNFFNSLRKIYWRLNLDNYFLAVRGCIHPDINVTKMISKRGIDKNYIGHTEELAGVKGKVQISQTLESNLLFKQKTICTYDDFSSDTISNRILVSTIFRLIKTKGLDKKLKSELIPLQRMLEDIHQIEITASLFKQVWFIRNNRLYGFIMIFVKSFMKAPSHQKSKAIINFMTS